MKFVVEALGLTVGGGKELALHLLRGFSNHREHRFVLLLPDLPEYGTLRSLNLTCLLFSKPRSLLKRYLLLNRTVVKVCSEQRADALLCLGNFSPRNPPCPVVVLLQHPYLVYKEPSLEKHLTLREKLIVAYGRKACRRVLPRALVIVQTEIVRKRLVRLYGLDPRKVTVVPSSCPFPPMDDTGFEEARGERSRPFTFLCISRYMPHKDFEILVEAINRLPAYTPKPARCVINVSAEQHPGARILLQRIEREGLGQRLVSLGWIPTREGFAEAYRSADADIFPSLMETFSFTYLEAMRFRLPVLTSDRDFAHDRCQDAALYFDPLNADSVAQCMARIVEDGELRHQLVDRATRLMNQVPTWDEIAAQFVAVLEYAAKGSELRADLRKEGGLDRATPILG